MEEFLQVLDTRIEAKMQQHPIVVKQDRMLTQSQFKELFGYSQGSYKCIANLRAQGCPFTGEGHNLRILESAAINWFKDRGKKK